MVLIIEILLNYDSHEFVCKITHGIISVLAYYTKPFATIYCACIQRPPVLETTVGWPLGHLGDTTVPLYKDHLSTEAQIMLSLEGSV